MELKKAKSIAAELIKTLSPYCNRIEIAGSIRRNKPEVKDIELVVIPSKYHLEKYFIDNKKLYSFNKNGGKYKQFVYQGINIDLFISNVGNFGLIYLIRTGSAEFSQRMLARWKQVSKGGYSKDGYLHTAEGEALFTFAEEEVFQKCEMEIVHPEDRV